MVCSCPVADCAPSRYGGYASHDGARASHINVGPAVIAIPLVLTLARLALGPVALWMTQQGVAREYFACVLVGGMLSDYFDGVLARRLGVARPWLRRLDSAADVVFYLFVLGTAYVLEGETLRSATPGVAVLVASETLCIGASVLKFGKLPATHCCSAKVYGLALFLAFFGVLCLGWGPWAIWSACVFGLLANGEVLAIILLSEEPPIDIPTVARLLRRTA